MKHRSLTAAFATLATLTFGFGAVEAHAQAASPSGLSVDQSSTGVPDGIAGNGVLEPGDKAVAITPEWTNTSPAIITITGEMFTFQAPNASTKGHKVNDDAGSYGEVAPGLRASCAATGDCYSVSLSKGLGKPKKRPARHFDSSITETLSTGDSKTWTLHVGQSFADVPPDSPEYTAIETLMHNGIGGGCDLHPPDFCPGASVTREQMAMFVLIAKEGSDYDPPACGPPVFNDVPASHHFCKFIEELARRGVVSGCGGGNYCPSEPVTRDIMADVLLKTIKKSTYVPKECTAGEEMFTDVPASDPHCGAIEYLARRGVVSGCGGGNYCPGNPVTREQMAQVTLLVQKKSLDPPACTTPAFADVPAGSPFCKWIEELSRRGVTGGCSSGGYCPSASTTREQMAVFVLRTLDPSLDPPACNAAAPAFLDVPANSPFCPFIEELFRRGVVSGCGGGNYCPSLAVTREAVTEPLLLGHDGAPPPDCVAGSEIFTDVPASNAFCKFIEELARRGVVSGCGGGNYCPANPVTRSGMATAITSTFGLHLYGP